MADGVEVKLGADASGIKTGVGEAADAVRAKLSQIGDYLKRVASDSKSTEAELKQVFAGLERGFSDSATAATKSSNAIVGSFSAMRVGLAAALGTIAGSVLMAVKGIQDLKDEAAAVETLQRAFGMTATEASRMNVALTLIGKSTQDYTAIAINLGRQIKVDEDRIQALGVKTRDAAGGFLPLNDVMKNAFDTMRTYKVGLDQNEFALEAFGRSAKDVYAYFDMNAGVMERAAQMQRDLGIEMGAEKRASIKAYAMDVQAMGIVWGEVRQSLGERLMPTLQALTGWFASIAPAAMTVFGGTLKLIVTALEGFGAIVAAVVVGAVAAFENLMQTVSALGRSFMAFMRGDWGAIPGILRESGEKSKAIQAAAADSVRAAWTGAHDRIKAVWSTPPAGAGAGSDKSPGGSRSWTPKAKGGGAAESRMPEFEAMLKAERDAYERMKLDQGSFERWSEEQTSSFWERIKTTYQLSTKELQSVESKWYDAQRTMRQKNFEAGIAALEAEKQSIKYDYDERIRIAQEAARRIAAAFGAGSREAIAAEARVTQEYQRQAEQRMRIAEIARRQEDARADHGANMEQLMINQRVALQQISAEQALAQEQGLQDRLYAIKRQALEREIALEREGPNDPTKVAAMYAALESLEMQHQQRVTEIQNRAVLERQQVALQANEAIRGSMVGFLNSLQGGIKNWRQALNELGKSITAIFNDLASKQIVKALMGAGTGGGDILSKITGIFTGGGGGGGTPPMFPEKAAEAAASSTLTAAKVTETSTTTVLTTIMATLTSAALAASAALTALAASQGAKAGGDMVGKLLGMALGGGTGGGGFGMDTALAGYATGTPYVPKTGLALIHRGERIVPAAENRGGFGGAASTINAPMTFNLYGPVDTRTQSQIEAAAFRGLYRTNKRNM